MGKRVKKIQSLKTISMAALCLFFFQSTGLAELSKAYTVKLPPENCQVKERWKGNSKQTIIHIQDAHSNIDAQKNISKLIDYLAAEEDVKVFGVEGATKEIRLERLEEYPSKSVKDTVTDWYVESGFMTGSEKARITSNQDFEMLGVEDPEIFRKNFRAYYGTMLKRDRILDKIDEIEEALADLRDPIYQEALILADQKVDDWHSKKIEITDYLNFLNEKVHELKIDLYDYVHYMSFMEALRLKQQTLKQTLKSEIETILDLIEEQINSLKDPNQSKYLEKFDSFKKKHLTKEEKGKDFFEGLKIFSGRLDIDFNTFPNIKHELEYHQKFSRVDMVKVMQEIETVTSRMLNQLAQTTEEKELIKRHEHIRILKKLSKLESLGLTVSYFRDNQSEFKYNYFRSFIEKKATLHGLNIKLSGEGEEFDKILKYIHHFYKGAQIRDNILVNNTLSEMEKRGQNVGTLIAGGFHTDGMTELLKKKGISYIVVSPRMDNLEHKNNYADKMMGNMFQLNSLVGSFITMQGSDLADIKALMQQRGMEDFLPAHIQRLYEEMAGETINIDQEDSARINRFIEPLLLASGFTEKEFATSKIPLAKLRSTIQVFLDNFELLGGIKKLDSIFQMINSVESENPLHIVVDPQTQEQLGEQFGIISSLSEMNPNIKIVTNLEELQNLDPERTVVLSSDPANALSEYPQVLQGQEAFVVKLDLERQTQQQTINLLMSIQIAALSAVQGDESLANQFLPFSQQDTSIRIVNSEFIQDQLKSVQITSELQLSA